LNVLDEKKALIKVIKCKIGVILSKWIFVGKNVYLFMCELSLKGGGPYLKIEIAYLESK